jgi:hypothetical protein
MEPLLRVEVGGREVGRIEEAPSEHDFVAQIVSGAPIIHFVKSDGTRIVHDLSQFAREPETVMIKWLHLCVVVHGEPDFGVQTDCILAYSDEESAAFAADADQMLDDYNEGKVPGVRIQPFFLPERTAPPPPTPLNSFERGLSYRDARTPQNTSVSCVCDECQRSFRLQPHYAEEEGREHSFVYCTKGIHVLTCSKWEMGAPKLRSGSPEPTDEEGLQRRSSEWDYFDQALPWCPHCRVDGTDTGPFSFFETENVFRCPHCAAPFLFEPAGRMKEAYWFELHQGPPAHVWSQTAVHPDHFESKTWPWLA